MRISSIWTAIVAIAFASCAWAQNPDVSITGPTLGYVADAAGTSIQPILGVPGASVLGSSLSIASDVRNAIISPAQDYALAVRGDDAEAVVIQLGQDPVQVNSLSGVRPAVDAIAFSPMGSAAAFYGFQSKILQSVVRFGTAPEVVFELDTSDLPGIVSGIAVSDDGKLALLTFANGDDTVLWLVTSSGFRWLVPAARPSAQAFVPNTHDAVVADEETQGVTLFRDPDQGGAQIPLVSGDGFQAISALATSQDGQRLFVTTKDSDKVIAVDLQTGLSVTVPCNCQSTGLQRLKGAAIFRVSDGSNGPIALLDTSSAQPRVIFVPVTKNHD